MALTAKIQIEWDMRCIYDNHINYLNYWFELHIYSEAVEKTSFSLS